MVMIRNDPQIIFPPSPALGETFARRQWDGVKWIPAGQVGIWDFVGDAPDDTDTYGRTEGDWRALTPFEHVFTVRFVATQSIALGTWTLINWDTVDLDTQGGWDNSLKRYTPQVAGLYLFQVLTPLLSSFIMQKNGGVPDHSYQIAASALRHWFQTYTTIAEMNGTSDYLVTFGAHNTSPEITTVNGAYRSELSAYRLPAWTP